MIGTQDIKIVEAARALSITNTTMTAIEVDATGWNSALFVLGSGATTGAISVFKVQYATTSGGSLTDVPSAALTTLPGASDDGKKYGIHVNLRDASIGKYLKIVITENNTGTGIYYCDCILSDPDQAPSTAAGRGLTAEVFA